jgi:hypothetical protein
MTYLEADIFCIPFWLYFNTAVSILRVDYVDGVIRLLETVGTYLINSRVSYTSHPIRPYYQYSPP